MKMYYLMERILGKWNDSYEWVRGRDRTPNEKWDKLESALLEHLGLEYLADEFDSMERVKNYLLHSPESNFLTVVEIFVATVSSIANNASPTERLQQDPSLVVAGVIYEINGIFRGNQVEYEIMVNANSKWGFQAVRVGSPYLNEEVVKKAAILLNATNFPGPLEEFSRALDFNTKGDYENAVFWAGRAFESTIKAILEGLKLPFDENNDKMKDLIDKLFKANLLSPSLKDLSSNIRQLLVGLLTVRNKKGGHGWGLIPREAQRSYAQLAVHLCGTYIVFLMERYEEERCRKIL